MQWNICLHLPRRQHCLAPLLNSAIQGPNHPPLQAQFLFTYFCKIDGFSPTRRHAADLELSTTAVNKDSQDCEHILAADLFSKLQSSYARIQGAYLFIQSFVQVLTD